MAPPTPSRPTTHRSTGGTISVIELDPDLLVGATAEERLALAPIRLPIFELSNEPFDLAQLGDPDAFGAFIVDGMVFHSLQVGAQPGMRILGPGDIVVTLQAPASDLIIGSEWRSDAATTVVPLGREMMLAVRRVPRLLASLHARTAEQVERLTTQLVISQLPRVEDRILSMLWLLAESFGHVTPAGTLLPLSLTHEMIGSIVGARRPTVSLALRALTEADALLPRDDGWLLLARPAREEPSLPAVEQPRLLRWSASEWQAPPHEAVEPTPVLETLLETVERLRAEHERNVEAVRERLRRTSATTRRAAELRGRLQRSRRLRVLQQPPSSE